MANTLYVANGAGSGSWRAAASFGAKVITNNATPFPVVAVADPTFNTPSQYTLLTGSGAPWTSENLSGTSFSVDRLTVSITGLYLINLWMNFNGFPSHATKVSIRYRLNGTGAFSTRKPTIKSAATHDVRQLTGFGLLSLNAGDYLQLYIASDTTGNLSIVDANNTLQLVQQTA